MSDKPRQMVTSMLAVAGVTINGPRPFDIQVHDERFYKRIIRNPELALGETYMDEWWDVTDLPAFLHRLLTADLHKNIKLNLTLIRLGIAAAFVNRQAHLRARKNAGHHYSIGNDLYERMLDKRMIYSCGYWKEAATLDEAQVAKLDLVCRKLHLKKGVTLLDIGCGWGGFAEYAAREYGAVVTGITPPKEQFDLAVERTRNLPVTILQQDYRMVRGSFDRIVSMGMMEHVGNKNYGAFFSACRDLLNEDGMMLHHTIGGNQPAWRSGPWIDKYIFPGGVIPSLEQIDQAARGKFIIEDLHNFGPDYDKTLLAWHNNFRSRYSEIQDNYDRRFYRMWEFYLLSAAAGFRARNLQLWQIVMRNPRSRGVYEGIR